MLLYVYCMMSDDVSTWFILSETWRGRWCVSIHRLAGSACRCFAIWPFECVCLGLGKRPTDFFGTRRRKVEWVHMQMFSSDATACRSDWSITCRGQDCVRWPRKEVVWWLKWRIWVQMLKAAYVWSTCIYHKKHPFFGFSFPNIVDPCCIHFFITSQLQCGVCRLHAPLINHSADKLHMKYYWHVCKQALQFHRKLSLHETLAQKNPLCQENQEDCLFPWLFLFVPVWLVYLWIRWTTTTEVRSVIPSHGWKTLTVQKRWYVLNFSCRNLNFFLCPKLSKFYPSSLCSCISGLCWRAEQTDHAVPGAVCCPASISPASHWALRLPQIQLPLQKREEVLSPASVLT